MIKEYTTVTNEKIKIDDSTFEAIKELAKEFYEDLFLGVSFGDLDLETSDFMRTLFHRVSIYSDIDTKELKKFFIITTATLTNDIILAGIEETFKFIEENNLRVDPSIFLTTSFFKFYIDKAIAQKNYNDYDSLMQQAINLLHRDLFVFIIDELSKKEQEEEN